MEVDCCKETSGCHTGPAHSPPTFAFSPPTFHPARIPAGAGCPVTVRTPHMTIPIELFIKEIEDAIVLPPGRLTPDQRLADLREFDSLSRLSVIALCDSRYGFVLRVSDLDGCKTVADLHSVVEKNATRA